VEWKYCPVRYIGKSIFRISFFIVFMPKNIVRIVMANRQINVLSKELAWL
jgi:hypothetical protein